MGLLPLAQPPVPDVTVVRLTGPEVILRAFAVSRRGQAVWPPLALVRDVLRSPGTGG